MTYNRLGTLPLPLALHLAMHTVIGLFCMFAGGLNLIDFWEKIWPNAIGFLSLGGFSWGYVFGLLMARREVVAMGLVASGGYVAVGLWLSLGDWRLGALLVAIGGYGVVTLLRYRSYILAT